MTPVQESRLRTPNFCAQYATRCGRRAYAPPTVPGAIGLVVLDILKPPKRFYIPRVCLHAAHVILGTVKS